MCTRDQILEDCTQIQTCRARALMVWVCCASGTTSRVPLSPGQRLRLPAAWVLLECWLIAHVRVARTRWLLNWWFCCTIAWPNELTCVPTLLFLLWVPVCSCVSRILCSRVHLALWFLRSDCLLCGIHSLRSMCVSVRALYLATVCMCSIAFRVLLFLYAMCCLFPCVPVFYVFLYPVLWSYALSVSYAVFILCALCIHACYLL